MKKVVYITFILCLICSIAHADKLSTYIQTKTLQNGDRIPVIIAAAGPTNANINWYDLKEMVSKNFNWADTQILHGNAINWTDAFITGQGSNWTDIRAYATAHGGDHSGINWQAFGV